MYEFGFPEARVSFVKQAVVEFGMRNSKVEDVNQFQRVTAANILNQFSRQVQDCGSSSIRRAGGHNISIFGGRVGRDDDDFIIGFMLSFQRVGRHRTGF